MKMQNEVHGKITDQGLEELRSRIGVEIKHAPLPYIEYATKDNIRHFAWGIGDTNPLWTDEDYAKQTHYGKNIAPPCILYAMDRIVSGYVGGLPGVHALFAGTDWKWFKPIFVNDQIFATRKLKDIVEKDSKFSNRAIQQIYEVSFYNQNEELVAVADSWCFRTERSTAKDKGKYKHIELQKYSKEDLDKVISDYEQEVVQGSEPQNWSNVNVGDQIPQIVKGPYRITDAIAWDQGWGGLYIRAHGMNVEQYKKHPALGILNSQGIPDVPESVHWDNKLARDIGAPGAYDYGPERITWLSQLMTNWIGDDGFLKQLYAEVRQFNVIGDTTWCRGKVIKKYIEGGEHLVDCELWGENQRGEVTTKGFATVALPNKN